MKSKQRTPPNQPVPLTLTISGILSEHIRDGAAASGLSPEQYVLSLLWHNVPLKQGRPSGLPDCVQLVLNDIQNHNCFPRPAVDPYKESGMTHDDFCGCANDIPF